MFASLGVDKSELREKVRKKRINTLQIRANSDFCPKKIFLISNVHKRVRWCFEHRCEDQCCRPTSVLTSLKLIQDPCVHKKLGIEQ